MRFPLRLPAAALALAIAIAGTPAFATPEAITPAWQVVDEQVIEVDGMPLALSPDGAAIAGLGPERDTLCVWDVVTLDPTCGDPLPTPIIERSVTWSPDSTAVAFSLDAPRLFRDSDIYIFETGTGQIVNLTEDDPDGTGADKISLGVTSGELVPIDLFPAWSPDSDALVFARTFWGGDIDNTGTTLMTISRDGGEPEELLTLAPPEPMIIYSPMHWLEDGSLLFSVWRADLGDRQNGVWRLDPEGDLTHLLHGSRDDAIPAPLLADVTSDGQGASILSPLNMAQYLSEPGKIYFLVSLIDGESKPLEEVVGLPIDPATAFRDDSDGLLTAPLVFSPEDNAGAYLTRTPGGDSVSLSILSDDGVARNVYTIERDPDAEPATAGSQLGPKLDWADNNTVLIISNPGIVLVTLDHTGEATPDVVPCGCTPPDTNHG